MDSENSKFSGTFELSRVKTTTTNKQSPDCLNTKRAEILCKSEVQLFNLVQFCMVNVILEDFKCHLRSNTFQSLHAVKRGGD